MKTDFETVFYLNKNSLDIFCIQAVFILN